MSSGQGPGPEDPRGSATPPDWEALQQGIGRSQPVPPEPEPPAGPPRPAEPPPWPAEQSPPYQGRRRAESPGPPPGRAGYQGAGPYRDPGGQDSREGYADPGLWRQPPRREGPPGRSEPPRYEPPGYEPAGPERAPGGVPELPAVPGPGRGPGRKPSAGGNPIWFVVLVVGVIVVAAIAAALLLLGHHGPSHHSAASTPPPSSPAHSPSASPTSPAPTGKPPPAPPRTAASGNLGMPRAIGSLRINPALTQQFVGPKERRQFADSFFIPAHDVASGFYTANPAATTFTAADPRLMFLAAYLHGSGDPSSALHSFMSNRTFTGQQEISAGPLGGKAACGQLAQQSAPVAHCMWADGNSYADFYAWDSSPSALARTMIAIRPQVELTHH